MSLINKMLADLEDRHNTHHGEDHILLDGLTPVGKTGFRSSRVPINLLLAGFFIIAVAAGIYSSFNHYSGLQKSVTEPGAALDMDVILEEPRQVVALIPSSPDEPQTEDYDGLPELTLDDSLSISDMQGNAEVDGITNIRNIQVEMVEKNTRLTIEMSAPVEFSVYTLSAPAEIFVELIEARMEDELPVLVDHPVIERIRISDHSQDRLVVVADLRTPVMMADSMLSETPSGYELNIDFRPIELQTTTPDNDDSSLSSELPVSNEILRGQMDIRAARVMEQSPESRFYADARNAYNNSDYETGDSLTGQLLAANPLHREARTLRAGMLIRRGQFGAAMALLEEGLQLSTDNIEWAQALARLQVDYGTLDEALETLSGSMPSMETAPNYHAFYAALLQRAMRHEDAIDVYALLTALPGTNGVWWMGMGISLAASGRNIEAVAAFRTALTDPVLQIDLRQYIEQQLMLLNG